MRWNQPEQSQDFLFGEYKDELSGMLVEMGLDMVEVVDENEMRLRQGISGTVSPARTFLEKAFLLAEEFMKDRPRTNRMSRHLYDIEKLSHTKYMVHGPC